MVDDDDDDYYEEPPQPTAMTKVNNGLPGTSATASSSSMSSMRSTPAVTATAATAPRIIVNTESHYERQYTCKQCEFFTNNPRAALYHRKEVHNEKINVHECRYCQYASQYSGKVERHTTMRHKFEMMSNNGAGGAGATSNNAPNGGAAGAVNGGANSNQKEAIMGAGGGAGDDEDDYDATNGTGAMNGRFQCNKCPCKYKRSSDLSKHLRLKHGLNSNHLNVFNECVELNTRHSNG